MIIIPVVDILDGQAVHARHGRRDLYQPVNSPLCPNPCPSEVIKSYLSVFSFQTFYLADLNAIMHKGDNRRTILGLAKEHPQYAFWVDAGVRSMEYDHDHGVIPVIGTETGISVHDLKQLQSRNDYILSLDFMNAGFIGDPELLAHGEYWPQRIIIMPLDRVGSRSGPDTELVASIRSRVPHCALYLGGGVRNSGDLDRLAESGISGALIASALHEKSLGPAELSPYKIRTKKTPA